MKTKAILLLMVLASLSQRVAAAEMALQVLHEFFPGSGPLYTFGPLLEESDGTFISTSVSGGIGGGTVYRISHQANPTVHHVFDGSPSKHPIAISRTTSGDFYGIAQTEVWWEAAFFNLRANDLAFSLVNSFPMDVDGGYPPIRLMFDGVQSFYGVTDGGGSQSLGEVWRITTNGNFSSLFSFDGTNGAFPNGGLIFGPDGLLYGSTGKGGHGFTGGFTGNGTVFKITTNGLLTTLAYFDVTNGAGPLARLAIGTDQRLYGTTRGGGTNGGPGTIFRVSTNGNFECIASFDGTNGGAPSMGSGLIQANDDKFYAITAWGTTNTNSVYGYVGTAISVTTNGEIKVVGRFNGTNTVMPVAELTLAKDGNIYGVAAEEGLIPSPNGNWGIFFRLAQVPEITSVANSNGIVHLTWTSFTNGVYQVQSRPTLAVTNWTTVSSNITATGDSCFFPTSAAGGTQGYYRIVLLP